MPLKFGRVILENSKPVASDFCGAEISLKSSVQRRHLNQEESCFLPGNSFYAWPTSEADGQRRIEGVYASNSGKKERVKMNRRDFRGVLCNPERFLPARIFCEEEIKEISPAGSFLA